MKRLLAALAALFAVAAGAADVALTRLAPADYTAVILVDVRKLLTDRDVQRVMTAPGVAERFAEVERVGLHIARIRDLAVFLRDNRWFGVMRFAGADALERDLERRSADPKSTIAAETVAGIRIFRLKRPPKANGKHKKKELCLVFPGDGVVVLAKAAEVKDFLGCPKLDAAATERLADTDAELWCEYRGKNGKPDEELDGIFNMTRGSLEIRMSGTDRRKIEVTGTGEFPDPAAAKSMGETLPGVLAFFAGLIFAEDPEGGDELVRAMRSEVRGGELTLSLSASEEMFRRFLRALEAFLSGGKHVPEGAAKPRRVNNDGKR